MDFSVAAAWDSVTLFVALVIAVFLYRLYVKFKGGMVGVSYKYYLGASIILAAGFVIRVALDLMQVDPTAFGLSVRDAAVILTLALFAWGLRHSVMVWGGQMVRVDS